MTGATTSATSELGRAAATSLLVSVRDAREATAALAGGADWIDLKEPHRGALGAVAASVAREVVQQVAGQAPVSAAAGELLAWRASEARELLEVGRIRMLKLGLAGCSERSDWQTLWKEAAAEIADSGKSLVAVAYADLFATRTGTAQPQAAELIALAAEVSSVKYLLVDTCDKQRGSLLEHWSREECRDIFQLAKAAGLKTVAAGGLLLGDLPALPLEDIDVVAVRGAVCPEARTGEVDVRLVRELQEKLDGIAS